LLKEPRKDASEKKDAVNGQAGAKKEKHPNVWTGDEKNPIQRKEDPFIRGRCS
jgi:hypothetical protein